LPFLRTLSLYKEWTFSIATLLIGFNFWLVYKKKLQNVNCEISENGVESACDTASHWSKIILWISVVLLFTGFFMAYLALPLMKFMDSL